MKKHGVKYWKPKVDGVFSRYIKLRDKQGGEGRCYTCWKWFPISELDAGHFRKRHHQNTRYDETNVQLQCKQCNRFEDGRPYEFGKKLNADFGAGTAERLKIKSEKEKHWTPDELEELYDKYAEKINQLERRE